MFRAIDMISAFEKYARIFTSVKKRSVKCFRYGVY